MKTIVQFFDPLNTEHIKAWNYLTEVGHWPTEFAIELEERFKYPANWQSAIRDKVEMLKSNFEKQG